MSSIVGNTVEGKIQRRYSNGDEGTRAPKPSCQSMAGYHVISLWLLSTLLGTHDPQRLGPEHKVLRVVLGWDSLHGLRLAKIEEHKSVVENRTTNGRAYT